jgi:DNA mismatch repair protein MutL
MSRLPVGFFLRSEGQGLLALPAADLREAGGPGSWSPVGAEPRAAGRGAGVGPRQPHPGELPDAALPARRGERSRGREGLVRPGGREGVRGPVAQGAAPGGVLAVGAGARRGGRERASGQERRAVAGRSAYPLVVGAIRTALSLEKEGMGAPAAGPDAGLRLVGQFDGRCILAQSPISKPDGPQLPRNGERARRPTVGVGEGLKEGAAPPTPEHSLVISRSAVRVRSSALQGGLR